MMSVHEVLEAWQAGSVTAARAMLLTGARDVLELHAFSHQSGVDIRTELLPREEAQARDATALINNVAAGKRDGARAMTADLPA